MGNSRTHRPEFPSDFRQCHLSQVVAVSEGEGADAGHGVRDRDALKLAEIERVVPDDGHGAGNCDGSDRGILKRLAADGRDALRNDDVAAETVVFFENALIIDDEVVRRGDRDGAGYAVFSGKFGINQRGIAGVADCRNFVIEIMAAFVDELGFESVVVFYRELRGRGAVGKYDDFKGVGSTFLQRKRDRRIRADRRACHRRKGSPFVPDAGGNHRVTLGQPGDAEQVAAGGFLQIADGNRHRVAGIRGRNGGGRGFHEVGVGISLAEIVGAGGVEAEALRRAQHRAKGEKAVFVRCCKGLRRGVVITGNGERCDAVEGVGVDVDHACRDRDVLNPTA